MGHEGASATCASPSHPSSTALCPTHTHTQLPTRPHLQAALARGEPVQYNKPDPLNPFFVVYGKRA